ncbi:MAG: carboxypeptidase regulatory-like domain-containing protein, partial [Planctomycetaceae bacterium]|nr:carboxypeptidase regulatory-like domain-containing protein [Planctomycetaceae bacterium]
MPGAYSTSIRNPTSSYWQSLFLELAADLHFEWVLNTTYPVSGTVRDPQGQPVRNAGINASTDRLMDGRAFRGFGNAFTAKDGTYTLQLPKGAHNFSVTTQDLPELTLMNVLVDGPQTLDIDLQTGVRLSAQIADEQGKGYSLSANLRSLYLTPAFSGPSLQTDIEGKGFVEVLPGPYLAQFYYRAPFDFFSYLVYNLFVPVFADTTIRVVVPQGVVIRGSVEDESAEPFSNTYLIFVPPGPYSQTWGTVADDGTYQTYLPPNRSQVVFAGEGDGHMLRQWIGEYSARAGGTFDARVERGEPVSGRLADRAGRGVAGLAIQAFSAEAGIAYTGRTEEGGTFRLNLQPGTYELTGIEGTTTFFGLGSVAVPFRDTLRIQRPTGGGLRGRVIDGATGEVVPGARVQALPAVRRPWFDDARWSRYAVAGPDGTFRLGDLPATSLLLAAGAPGGCSWSGGVTVEGGVVEEVQLSILPEEPAEAVLLERGTGRPAAGARFLVTSSGVDIPGGTNRLAEVEVDAEGRLPAGALGRGPFDLLLLRPVPGGPWTSDVFSGVTLGRLPGSQGPVPGRSRGSRPPALPVEVERSLSVEGVLRDGEGRALPGVLVHGLGLALPQWQSTPFPTFAGSAWTRADGTFRMDGLPRGRVLLRTGPSLSSQEDMERIETGGPGVLDLRRGAPEGVVVTGTPGEPVALPPAATASGRVLGPDGEPVPGACLRWRVEVRPGGINERPLLAAEANLVRETAAVGRDGSFTLRGLRRDPAGGEGPAVLLLAASAPGFPLRLQALPFEEGGTTAGLEVRLEPGRTIEGRLRRPDGSPAPGVPLLSLGGPAPRTVRGATREDGTFRLTGLPAGPLLLSAGWQAEEAGRWTLPPRDGLLEKTLPAAAHCSGRVSDPEGRPLEGVLLTWVADGLPTRREGRSEADGSFRIPVPAGAGRLWIENPGGEGGSAWPFLPLEVATPPGGQEGLDLRLERGLPLAGVLRGGRGAPLPGATVSAEFQHRGRRWSRQVVIGPDGQFQVHGLPPGDLLLRLHKGGAGAVVAASAGDLHLQVRLEGGEGAVLAGVATKEFGMPAAMATVVAWASKEPAPSGIATPCDGAGRFRM